jgi:hypothetical protein
MTGTIGQKAGFTETLDTQVKKILGTTSTALKRVALKQRPAAQKAQPQIRDEEFLEVYPPQPPPGTKLTSAKPATPPGRRDR